MSVNQLRDELCIAIFAYKEEKYFEAIGIKKKSNDEHKLDAKEDYFDEQELDSVSDEERDFIRIIFDG